MINKCPNCGIDLRDSTQNYRITNEVILTLSYRRIIEQGKRFKEVEELGYCELCRATKKDIEEREMILLKELNKSGNK